MAQTFHPSMNTIAKASIFGFVFFVAGAGWLLSEITRSPYLTEVNVAPDQPVPFSHEHHVSGLGIDCRYCHTSADTSSFAGIPATKTCMTCHSQIWTNASILAPVRQSWRENRPIKWRRVNQVPDFVNFNHSIHVNKGIGCSSCHGQVDQMPLMMKAYSLQMQWCLACHREPERYIRPRDQVYNMAWRAPSNQLEIGRQLVKEYHVNKQQLTNCSICHY